MASPRYKCWQVQHVIQRSGASREEIKVHKEVFAVAVDTTDRLDRVLEKLELSKAINFCAWIARFLHNSRRPDQKSSGPLTTEDMKKHYVFCVKIAQRSCDFQDNYL